LAAGYSLLAPGFLARASHDQEKFCWYQTSDKKYDGLIYVCILPVYSKTSSIISAQPAASSQQPEAKKSEISLMKLPNIDYSLYLVTDRGLARGRSTLEIVTAAINGGATVVQLREKDCSTLEYIEQALSIKAFLKTHHIPLIINDRVDVAQAIQADGVHLGQTDMPLEMAKGILGDTMIIGISAESIEDAITAEKGGADYLGVSPIYATPTKTDTAPALGLEGLKEIRRAVRLPIVGIGGLNQDNATEVIRNGADGVAVVSAIVAADNPEIAARELKQVIREARQT
jgi:thiamine-phosphate pyrophosphorylase